MSKQKKPVYRKDTEEGKKEYVTWVPDFLVPTSIPNKVQLYFSATAISDTACCIFVITPLLFYLS